MTNRSSVPDFAGLFGGISALLSETVTNEFFPEKTETSKQEDGVKYKNASDLSAGDVVILPSGGEHTIQSVSLVDGDDQSVEVSFVGYETETQYPLKNWKIAVK